MFWDKYYLAGLLLGVVLGGLGVIASAAGPEGVAWAWPWDSVLLLVNVNWFLGGLMTGRGSSSGISGSWSGPRPKIPKGSGDPKQILDLIWFCRYAVFLNGYAVFSVSRIPRTHRKNGKVVFLNRYAVLHCGYAILLADTQFSA